MTVKIMNKKYRMYGKKDAIIALLAFVATVVVTTHGHIFETLRVILPIFVIGTVVIIIM